MPDPVYVKTLQIVPFNWVQFIVCKLHPNEADLKVELGSSPGRSLRLLETMLMLLFI